MGRLVIVNPVAGFGFTSAQISLLKSLLEADGEDYEWVVSNGPNEIYEMCAALDEGWDEVIIAGGDGSVQEVIKGVLGKRISVTIVPSGTGNDLYRSVHPNHNGRVLDEIIGGLFESPFVSLHVCDSNQNLFINVASMGLDAKIVENSLVIQKWIKSSKSYLLSALATILFYKPKNYRIVTDGVTITLKAYLVAVGNGRYYGGGMEITPRARLMDEEVDICVVKNMNRFKLLKLLPTVYSGQHLAFEEVIYWKAKSVEIYPEKKELINLDGELLKNDCLVIHSGYGRLFVR